MTKEEWISIGWFLRFAHNPIGGFLLRAFPSGIPRSQKVCDRILEFLGRPQLLWATRDLWAKPLEILLPHLLDL